MAILDPNQEENYNYDQAPLAAYPPYQQYQPEKIRSAPTVFENSDFFLHRLSFSDILDNIQHQLRGETAIYLPDGSVKYKKLGKDPILNEYGINQLMNYLNSVLNKNTILSCFTHDEIYIKMNTIYKELALLIRLSYKTWDLKKSHRTTLLIAITDQIHGAFSRAWDGREADQLSTQHQRVDTFAHAEQQNTGGGILSNLFNRGGRR